MWAGIENKGGNTGSFLPGLTAIIFSLLSLLSKNLRHSRNFRCAAPHRRHRTPQLLSSNPPGRNGTETHVTAGGGGGPRAQARLGYCACALPPVQGPVFKETRVLVIVRGPRPCGLLGRRPVWSVGAWTAGKEGEGRRGWPRGAVWGGIRPGPSAAWLESPWLLPRPPLSLGAHPP